MPAAPDFSEAGLSKKTVAELKSLLKQAGLKVGGNKAELISDFQTSTERRSFPSQNVSVQESSAVSGPTGEPPAVVVSEAPVSCTMAGQSPSVSSDELLLSMQSAELVAPRLPPYTADERLPPSRVPASPHSILSILGSLKYKSETRPAPAAPRAPAVSQPQASAPLPLKRTPRTPFRTPFTSNNQLLNSELATLRAQPPSHFQTPTFSAPSPLFATVAEIDASTLFESSGARAILEGLSESRTFFDFISDEIVQAKDYSLQMSLRFLLYRINMILALPATNSLDPLSSLAGVLTCTRVTEGVWEVQTSASESLCVLEATGEVLGTVDTIVGSTDRKASVKKRKTDILLREDWKSWIEDNVTRGSLLGKIRCSDEEGYPHGVSRLFVRRCEELKASGGGEKELRIVATSFLFSQCTVRKLSWIPLLVILIRHLRTWPHSISGAYSSTASEAQIVSGSSPPSSISKSTSKLGFYLPPAFHLESVVLASSTNNMHQALAVVTTAEREYFVLKDTGQIVGSDDEGVGEVWIRILGCGPVGTM